ncbi:alkaline phosphatase family protein [Nocardioides lijunqiniae]|uniref:alkaline phosphatase family protein n=1 Tax=Nocardioides lijunqiniae TaxID=2760832 RepID=UPI00187895E0|nr:alkaline phosphatase family protein [Nocardioides lijunqiniae]
MTTPFEAGLAEVRTGRRTLLKVGGAGLAFSTAVGTTAAAAGPPPGDRKRAYVLVIDGCIPGEIDGGLTPRLRALRDGGHRFPRAVSMPIMETIPNHVMMMTGMRPDRTGVPANAIYDRRLGETRTMDRASDIRVDTVIQRLNRRGYRTGTVLSKEYLYGVFGARATHRWEPAPIIPVSGHAPDVFTMRAARTMVREYDPHLMFVNLGDIDRFGHSDFTGTTVRLARRLALADTDRLVGQFVDMLQSTGRWRHSMLIVLADHSMDWSTPDKVISLQASMDADPLLAGKVRISANGGADLLYWTGATADRPRAIHRMRQIALATPGVLSAPRRDAKALRLGPNAGDVVVFCKAGWRFSDPNPVTDNPIPGNHGHPATRPIPFFIAGGHPRVPHRKASSALARTVDVAPTVASFFGAGKPRRGWDGRARI